MDQEPFHRLRPVGPNAPDGFIRDRKSETQIAQISQIEQRASPAGV
jgi:hypothetical protein